MMHRALELAARGLYTTHPNPRVGCVIVNGDRIVGEGWHVKAGDAHAEVNALKQAGDHARGATVYVTLEPCSHLGRTPPCVDALIAAGIRRVVYATQDPNPLVNGGGLNKLREAGIVVDGPVCEAEARSLNAGFIKRMQQGLPLVRLKLGMSADGRTALANGVSKWITSELSRHDVQRWRARSSAVLTGIGTVLADDPQMNVRADDIDMLGRQVFRIVCDSHLRIPSTAKLLDSEDTLIYTAAIPRMLGKATIVPVGDDGHGHVDLHEVLRDLAKRGCNEILVEAGAILSGTLLSQNLIDEILLYVAPVLLGHDARPLVKLPLIAAMTEGTQLELLDILKLGSDVRLHYRLNGSHE